jgi:demethylmenaquinone methyltransferase / 2-methoxy-6-polyprenyl-1,4-benzoquinol methylase
MSNTHFGFESVDEQEKAKRVRGVFDSVASKYDVMNDLMSAGLHRVWKKYTVTVANVREGQAVLDIAGGTGLCPFGWSDRSRGPYRHQPSHAQ